MSQNVIGIINSIFEKVIDFTENDDKYRIANTKRFLEVEANLVSIAFNMVSNANLKVIKTNDFVNILSVSYKEEKYAVFPDKYSESLEVIGLKKVEDSAIEQGIGILALGSGYIGIKEGITSLEIINQCLELEPEDGSDHVNFTYNQITDFFQGFEVVKVDDGSFKMEYKEDFLRMYAIMLTVFPNDSLTEKTYCNLREILHMESSRSVSESIISTILSGMNEHKFLELYQCIEYLFIIYNAGEIASKYSIDKNNAVDLVINENLKITELSNVSNIIGKYASETLITNFYDVLLDEGECDNKPERVSKYIYKIRCNVAHLRYKQEQLLETLKWKDILENVSNIILSIYRNMDDDIISLCKNTNAWTSI